MNLPLPSRLKFVQLNAQKHQEWNQSLLVLNMAKRQGKSGGAGGSGGSGSKNATPSLNMMAAKNVNKILLDTLEMANASVSLSQKDVKNPKADLIKTFFDQSHHNISTLYQDWYKLYSTVYILWYGLSETQRLAIQTGKDSQSVKQRKNIELAFSQLASIQQDISKQFSDWAIVFFGNNLQGAQQVIDFTLDLLKTTEGGKIPPISQNISKIDSETAMKQLILTDDLEVQILKLKLINEGYDEYDLDRTISTATATENENESENAKGERERERSSVHLFRTKTGRTISEIENTSNYQRQLISGQPHEGKGDESRALVLTRSLLDTEKDDEKEKNDKEDKRVTKSEQRDTGVERVERTETKSEQPKKSKSSLFSLKNLSGLTNLGLQATALVTTAQTLFVGTAVGHAAVLGGYNIVKLFGYTNGWIEFYQSLGWGAGQKIMAVGNFLAYNGLYNVEINPALAEPSIDRSMLSETQYAMNRTLLMISILRSTLVVGRVAKQWADQAAFRYEEKERQSFKATKDDDEKEQKDEAKQIKEKKKKQGFLSKMARAWNRMNGVKINVPWLLYACGIGALAGSYILDYVNGTAYQTFVPLSDLIPKKGVSERTFDLLKKAMGLWGEPPGAAEYVREYVNIPWNMGIFMEFWNQLKYLNPGLYYTGFLTGAVMEVLLVTIGGKIFENLLNTHIVKPGRWKGLTDASNYRMQARCLLAITRTIWNLSPFAFMASTINLLGISLESNIELPQHKLDFVVDMSSSSDTKKLFVPSNDAIDILADRYPSDKEFVLKMSKWFATHLLLSFTSTAVQTIIEVAENFRPLSIDEKAQLIADATKQLTDVQDLARLAAVAKLTVSQKEARLALELMTVDAVVDQQQKSLLQFKQTGKADSTIRYLAQTSPLLIALNQQQIAGRDASGEGEEKEDLPLIQKLLAPKGNLSKADKEVKQIKEEIKETIRQVGDERTAIQTSEQKLIEYAPYADMANRLQNPETAKLNQEKREGVLGRLQQLLPFGGGLSDFQEASNELTREANSEVQAQTTAMAVAAVQSDPTQMKQFIAKGNKAIDISADIMRQLQQNIKYDEPDDLDAKNEDYFKSKRTSKADEEKEEEQEEEEQEEEEGEEEENETATGDDQATGYEQDNILNDDDEVA